MKTKLFAVAVALLLSALATGTCYAQQAELSVKIPFRVPGGESHDASWRISCEVCDGWIRNSPTTSPGRWQRRNERPYLIG